MEDRNRNKKRSFNPGIVLVIAAISLLSEAGGEIFGSLLAAVLGFAILLTPILVFIYVFRRSKKNHSDTSKEPAFDSCPKTFCFHKDKGEHHVRKGREIDPWDRPDIDISKYQRKQ